MKPNTSNFPYHFLLVSRTFPLRQPTTATFDTSPCYYTTYSPLIMNDSCPNESEKKCEEKKVAKGASQTWCRLTKKNNRIIPSPNRCERPMARNNILYWDGTKGHHHHHRYHPLQHERIHPKYHFGTAAALPAECNKIVKLCNAVCKTPATLFRNKSNSRVRTQCEHGVRK